MVSYNFKIGKKILLLLGNKFFLKEIQNWLIHKNKFVGNVDITHYGRIMPLKLRNKKEQILKKKTHEKILENF